MRVAVTGATGMIGSALVRALLERGDRVTALTREAARARDALRVAPGRGETAGAPSAPRASTGAPALDFAEWPRPKTEPPPAGALRGHDGVVNLLGEPIAQRWTDASRREIRDSRVLSTRNLVAALADLPPGERPGVLVSQSGVDWYPDRGDARLDESEPPGQGFLAGVVKDWEAEARRAEEHGVRVALTRTGVVLSPTGGALARMLPFFKLGIGGPVAGGRQYMAWVHLDDVVGAMLFCLDTDAARGPINATAPEPATNKQLSRALGRVLRRPAVAPVPGFALRALYGEMATVVTTGRRAVPARLTELGYSFRRPELEPALRDSAAAGRR